MTVMPSTCDVADKAVSTSDGNTEVARLEAVLAALVETKVEAIKASSTFGKRAGSAPASPRRPRLTSTSTASSSLNYHHHHQHHHHHHHHQQQQQQQHRHHHQQHEHEEEQHEYKRKNRHHHHHHHQHHHHYHRRKRHDSAPCGDYIEDSMNGSHHKSRHGKEKRRASESPRSPRKKRRHSKSPRILHGVIPDLQADLDGHFELLDVDGDQDLALINFERTKEALSDSCEYPRLHRSACYISQSTAQLKIHYDEDEDYLALNIVDGLEEEETLNGAGKIEEARETYHRPKKKRKRKRRRIASVGPEEEVLADPEELPPRARWTIVATACLLLAMSLLLVGVTLRMAPIIDDMGDSRRTSVCRKARSRRMSSATRRKSSVHATKVEANDGPKVSKDDERNDEQARRHRRVAMIVFATFLFLLVASILVVVVTLTHSSFHSPPTGSRELAKHRTQLRKENEELFNSLNRDSFVPENTTTPP